MVEESRKVGRPTKYKEEYAELAYKFSLLGAIDAQLAQLLEISESTLNNWKHEHPEFSESIKKGKEIADVEVVEALRKRAIGYSYEEIKTEESDQGNKRVVTTKEVVGDTTAQIFWLKNRQPRLWRDKQEIDHQSSDGSMTPTRSAKEMTDDELAAIAGGDS